MKLTLLSLLLCLGWADAAWAICGKACICGSWNNYCRGGQTTFTTPPQHSPITSGPTTSTTTVTSKPPADPVLIVRRAQLDAEVAQVAAVLERPTNATKSTAGTILVKRIKGNWDEGYDVHAVIAETLLPAAREARRGLQAAGPTAWQQFQDAVGVAALAYGAASREDAAFLADQVARTATGEEVLVELRRSGVSPFSVSRDMLGSIASVTESFGVKFDEVREIRIRKAELQITRRKNEALLAAQGCDSLGHCEDAAKRAVWRETVAKLDSEIAALDVREIETQAAKAEAIAKLAPMVRAEVKIVLHPAKN
jgi:hypothetical protein